MREIKFRVWDLAHNKIIGIFTLKELAMSSVFIDYGERNLSIEQFTGMKDKNKIDEYEGDILKIDSTVGNVIGFIAFDGDKGRFVFQESSGETWGITSKDSHNEIIGNIHENHNLLEAL